MDGSLSASTCLLKNGFFRASELHLSSVVCAWESTTFIPALLRWFDNTTEFLCWWYFPPSFSSGNYTKQFSSSCIFFSNNELEFCSMELYFFFPCCSLWWVWWEHLSPPAAFGCGQLQNNWWDTIWLSLIFTSCRCNQQDDCKAPLPSTQKPWNANAAMHGCVMGDGKHALVFRGVQGLHDVLFVQV